MKAKKRYFSVVDSTLQLAVNLTDSVKLKLSGISNHLREATGGKSNTKCSLRPESDVTA